MDLVEKYLLYEETLKSSMLKGAETGSRIGGFVGAVGGGMAGYKSNIPNGTEKGYALGGLAGAAGGAAIGAAAGAAKHGLKKVLNRNKTVAEETQGLTLRQLQDKMVPTSAKAGKDIDSQWLEPGSFDKKLVKATMGNDNNNFKFINPKKDDEANFKLQDKLKHNTKAPMMPGTKVVKEAYNVEGGIASGSNSYAVYNAYEEESLNLLEEIMDLVESDDSIGYYWQDVARNLKCARDCLLQNVVKEDLNENFKVGSFKLKDGSKVTLDKNDVKVLNDAVAGTKSQEKMISSATKNKNEFSHFLEFAKSLHENYDLALDALLEEASIEQLNIISNNDLNEGETWDLIKGGAKAGSTIGKHVGATVGAAGGGLYGGTVAAGVAGTTKLVKTVRNIKNKRKEAAPESAEASRGTTRPYNPNDAKVSPGETRKNPLKEGLVTVARITPNNKKKSIAGTSAPALDSDPHTDRDNSNNKINESKGIHKFNLPKKGSLKDLINKSYKRAEAEKEDFEIKHDQVGNAKVKKDLKESGGLGGHPANYRNPAEGPIKFGKVESGRDLKTYVISNNKANIMGELAKKVGDIVNVKSDRNMFHKMEVIEINGNKLKVKPVKKTNLHEISKEKLEKYLDKSITDHGHSNFARNSTKEGTKASDFWTKRTEKRKKGISKAIDILDSKKD